MNEGKEIFYMDVKYRMVPNDYFLRYCNEKNQKQIPAQNHAGMTLYQNHAGMTLYQNHAGMTLYQNHAGMTFYQNHAGMTDF
ncbi:MAG: hypothetical protein M0R46_18025 [Candidatus Muirbacterium halophilum]|nr:hypothetical protein [Candidatus Muirbacterium halophilum]